jgi:hypothetical protein
MSLALAGRTIAQGAVYEIIVKSRVEDPQITTHLLRRKRIPMQLTMWVNLSYGLSTVNDRVCDHGS